MWKFVVMGSIVFCASHALMAQAEVYRWVDGNGEVHYSDQPPATDSKPLDLQINSYEGVTYSDGPGDVNQKVVMYSATWCGVCKQARRYFKDNNIAYKEYDIEKSRKGKADYKRLQARGVPVILVGRQRMNGFSVAGFKKLYQ